MNRLISMVTGMGRPSHLPRRQPFNLSWLAESPEKLRNLIGVLHRRKGELRRLTENEGVYKEVYASMDVMMAEDFGIDVGEDIPEWARDGDIFYQSIIDIPDFCLCAFMLMPKATLPYHDHPHQHVVSRVVSGTLTADVFNPIAPYRSLVGQVFAVKPVVELNGEHKQGTTMFLNPAYANIHSFVNLTNEPCVFVDLIMPPYGNNVSTPAEPFISYFERRSMSDDGEQELVVIDEPEDFATVNIPSRLHVTCS
ncbi:conserved hypothetical protein [Perkinsus marinus ATCC 50983]|uniref:Cysteine dioxygenase n=1 Tax=Perkinsus marinus (strain ATCC 50983 / TXsc) TaxID=423536 RepID=C5L7B2_PERM5|nr:conserved hypothetical protein [Perkinsus marinus ATCC 50983]EER07374.1 conserved hypothetical protein [Perkinsus marinus ATCC 50983]|eukprot:XP_002775558.1 conserved hypothetical protein [Perkinsus marinus ATCC 50983]